MALVATPNNSHASYACINNSDSATAQQISCDMLLLATPFGKMKT
jgi:hypothetical protein